MSARPFASIRTYRARNPWVRFLCPLCGIERGLVHPSRLGLIHYLQITILTLLFMLVTYSWIEWKGGVIFFFFWGFFEATVKSSHRKEIPCPDCGFDATWYKRDVKMARKLVRDFWDEQKKK